MFEGEVRSDGKGKKAKEIKSEMSFLRQKFRYKSVWRAFYAGVDVMIAIFCNFP
jgi:hypothetical protein